MSDKKKTKKLIDQVSIKITENDNATTTVSVVADYQLIKNREEKAFNDLAKNVKADGFRPGKVPTELAKKQIPHLLVLEQAGRDLIADLYLPILQNNKIDAIGEPQINIKKLAEKNDFEFDIVFTLAPKVELGDYKKVIKSSKSDKIDPKVKKDELEQAIQALRQQWAQREAYAKKVKEAKTDEEKAALDPRLIQIDEKDWPELTDEWVKELGNYESVKDFKSAFETNIKTNKALEELEKRRANLLSEIVKQAKFSVPELVYQSEQKRLIDIRKSEVKEAGLKWSEYLNSISKTEDKLVSDFKEPAIDRVHTQLVIAELANAEGLEPEKKEVDKEVEFLAKRYPQVDKANLIGYVYSQLMSQKVLTFLAPPQDTDKTDKKGKKGKASTKTKAKTKTTPKKKVSSPKKKESAKKTSTKKKTKEDK